MYLIGTMYPNLSFSANCNLLYYPGLPLKCQSEHWIGVRIAKPAGVAKWMTRSLVDLAARDRISLLPKISIHHCLPYTACMMDVHAYTVYTPIGGKGRCSTRRDPWVHRTQASKCAGERTTLALKPMGRVA